MAWHYFMIVSSSLCYLCYVVLGMRFALYSSSDRDVKNANWIPPILKNLFRILGLDRSFGHQKSGSLHDYPVDVTHFSEIKLYDTGSRNVKVVTTVSHYWFCPCGAELPGQKGSISSFMSPSQFHSAFLSTRTTKSRTSTADLSVLPWLRSVLHLLRPTVV